MKRIVGRKIHKWVVVENNNILPKPESVAYIGTKSYFDSVIENHIEFFNPEYLDISFIEASYRDIKNVIHRKSDNTILGRVICNIYYGIKERYSKIDDETILQYLINEFYLPYNIDENETEWNIIRAKYIDKLTKILDTNMIITSKTEFESARELFEKCIEYKPFENGGYFIDLHKYCISTKILITENMKQIIPISSLFELSLSDYDIIIMGHASSNSTILSLDGDIDGNSDLEKIISKFCSNTDRVLLLVCNDHDINLTNLNIASINYPNGGLLSELYILNI